MTREEALVKIGELVAYARNQGWDDSYTDAFKTLEQEPILDKIRAEIDKSIFIDKDTRIAKNALASGLEVAMQIIDKCKGESEG